VNDGVSEARFKSHEQALRIVRPPTGRCQCAGGIIGTSSRKLFAPIARMAKSVDAADLKSARRKAMPVRVRLRAPKRHPMADHFSQEGNPPL
jgi:hypothetical protein